MKRILLFISIFYSCCVYSQTYVGPVIGYDYSRIEADEDMYVGFYIYDNKYIKSPFIGVKLEQIVYHTLYFSYQFDYLKKKVLASSNEYIAIQGIQFNYYRHSFNIKYLIKNLLYIGIGWNYNLIRELKFVAFKDDSFRQSIDEMSLKYTCGIKFKNCDLGFYYIDDLTSKRQNSYPAYLIKPISSYGVGLSYDFKIFNAPNFKRGTNCPRF
jgi:hypothetical protein